MKQQPPEEHFEERELPLEFPAVVHDPPLGPERGSLHEWKMARRAKLAQGGQRSVADRPRRRSADERWLALAHGTKEVLVDRK